MRNDTRGAIMRRDLSSTLERGKKKEKERKKEEKFRVPEGGTQARNKYRIKAGVREWLRGNRTQASTRKDDGKLADA